MASLVILILIGFYLSNVFCAGHYAFYEYVYDYPSIESEGILELNPITSEVGLAEEAAHRSIGASLLDEHSDTFHISFPRGNNDEQKCTLADTCISITACLEAHLSPSKFPTCKWEGVMPFICCPSAPQQPQGLPQTKRGQHIQPQGGDQLPQRDDQLPQVTPPQQDLAARESILEDECVADLTRTKRNVDITARTLQYSIDVSNQTSQNFTTYVIGGVHVDLPEKWPFMVGIYEKLASGYKFLCGGSLITRTTVLTAAHCFLEKPLGDTYMLRMGDVVQFSGSAGAPNTLHFETSTVKLHPDFKFPIVHNDIALIKFSGVSEYTSRARPVCLPSVANDDQLLKKGSATVVGWGAQVHRGELSQNLQEVEVPIVLNNLCNNTFSSLRGSKVNFPNGISSDILCAGNVGQSKDACGGDSGGPLVVLDGEQMTRQIGVVSSGVGCGKPGIPGIYTRVDHFLDWIKANI